MARKKKSASIVRCAWRTMLQVFKKVAARRTRTDHAWCYVRSLQPVEETSAPLIFFSPLLFMPRLLVVRLLGIVAVTVVRTQDLLEQDTYKK